MSDTVGFIGLGNLGLPMASNLLGSGYGLRVFNRTAGKAEPLVAQGAELTAAPFETIVPGGVVVSVLWDDESLERVVRSEGFLSRLGPGGVHVSMTTVSPEMAKRMAAAHAEHGSVYVEATVFGRPEAAINRQLLVPIAGPEAEKARVKPLISAMGAEGIFDFGQEIGAASLVKLIGNFLIVSAGHSMREAVSLARSYGVDPKAVVEMLTSTLFSAPIYKSYGKRIAEGPMLFGTNPIPLKDVGLFRKTASETDLPTPVAELLEGLLSQEESE